LHKSRDLEASLTGGADLNAYAYTKGLNFLTTRLDGYAILDSWVDQLAKGAQLRVDERFRYTPESPGFLTGAQGSAAGDPFLRGIQGFRANTYTNTVRADGSYPVVRGLALQGRYSFSIYRVGSVLTATTTGAAFFDTTVNTWSVGPRYDLTPVDSISLSFQQSLINQTRSGGGTQDINTNTQALLANYTKVMPDWKFDLVGGVTLIEPASKALPTASITISTNPERSTIVQFDLSRQASPSFYIQSGVLISNVGQLQVTHLLSERLSLRGSTNYGYNETVPDALAKFTNFTVSMGLNYKLTRTMAVDLFYIHNDFKTDSPGLTYTILRNVVGFALNAQWN
jgi:opacity protein-like surface antigen